MFFSKKHIHVNEEQYNAITRPIDVNQRIIASAGSGKTTTITARIAYLIEHHKVESNRIVLLTFSRNSASQMKQKLYDLIGSNEIWAGTFHGLAKTLLQKYSPKTVQSLYFIDELVSMGEEWLHTERGRKWVSRIRYIFVDEFQDINQSQWNMIMRMRHIGARIVVVGDDCQNIYTWRGSNIDFILNLEKYVRHIVDDQLYINYRSSDSIIQVANAVMKNIPTLPWKHTMISAEQKHEKPNVRFFYRVCDETSWIIKQIEKKRKEEPNASIAIMSRMNLDLYRFEEECIMKNICYRLFDIGINEQTAMEEASVPPIDLVTIHSSKGLEWDIVYLVHMNDEVFPSKKNKEEIVNERRLFYVAVTRARKELYMSYTNDERSLSRFVREIPNTLLLYHGIAKYMLSEFELGKTSKRLQDILGSLTTEDITELRRKGLLDWFNTDQLTVRSLYPHNLYWKKPEWIRSEMLGDFQRFLHVWLRRHFCGISGKPYRDPTIERLIFTLRIYAEDYEFWSLWKKEIEILVHTYFGNIGKNIDIPPVEYRDLDQWSKTHNIAWNYKDIICATNIMGKLRGQLRPLRFYDYNINEFIIGPSRFVVPIQWRGEVLDSWRKLVGSTHWSQCLVDIWKIGAVSLVAQGRNVAMYRATRLKEHLANKEFQEFLECVEQYTGIWICEEKLLGTSIHIENEENIVETIDIQTETSSYNIASSFNSADMLRLAIASTFEENIQTVGIFVPLDGKVFSLKLPPNMKELGSIILDMALNK